MKLLSTSILLLLLFQNAKAKAWDFYNYCDKNQTSEEFVDKFPFQDYLQKHQMSNIDILRKHYNYLQKQEKDADSFLIILANSYIEGSDIKNIKEIKTNLNLAEKFLNQKEDIFKIMADVIFQYLATNIEKDIQKGDLDKHNSDIKQIVKQLAKHQYIINIPMTKQEKLWKYTKEGEWSYIWNRAMLDYPILTLGGLSLLILLILGGVYWVLRGQKSDVRREKTEDRSQMSDV